MTTFAAPPHTFIHRYMGPGKYEARRLLGWDDQGRQITDDTNGLALVTETFIPAQPGWYAVSWHNEDPEDEPDADWRFSKTPIVAWRMTTTSCIGYAAKEHEHVTAWPVLANNMDDHNGYTLGPDGLVYGYEDRPLLLADWIVERKKGMVKPQ